MKDHKTRATSESLQLISTFWNFSFKINAVEQLLFTSMKSLAFVGMIAWIENPPTQCTTESLMYPEPQRQWRELWKSGSQQKAQDRKSLIYIYIYIDIRINIWWQTQCNVQQTLHVVSSGQYITLPFAELSSSQTLSIECSIKKTEDISSVKLQMHKWKNNNICT